MLEISRQLIEQMNSNKINYCHFKSNEHLYAGLSGETDLDILVSFEDKDIFERLLTDIDFKQFEPVKIGEYPGVVNWYGFDRTTGRFIHLHIHYQLVTGKGLLKDYILPWSELILKSSIMDPELGVKINNPNLEYLLLCTRLIVKRKLRENLKSFGSKIYIEDDIKRELLYLKQKVDEPSLKNYINRIYPGRNVVRLYKLMISIDQLSYREFRELDKVIRETLHKDRRVNGCLASILSFKNRLIRSTNRKINKLFGTLLPVKKRSIKRGVSFAFVGIDGSGKSTVSSNIKRWLSSEFDTIRFYAGEGDGKKNFTSTILLKGYSCLKKNNKKKIVDDEIGTNFSLKTKNTFIKKTKNLLGAWAYYKILKDNIEKIIKSNKYSDEGCFCIMDRFPQSQLLVDHDGPKVAKYLKNNQFKLLEVLAIKEENLLYKLDNDIPKFDIVFRMNVSPEEAIKRKPDHSFNAMKRRAETLRKIEYSAKKVIDIDANDALEKVILKVKEAIWDIV